MTPFSSILDRALDRHGEAALRARFPAVAGPEGLRALSDPHVLATLTQRVFSAGFRWSVIAQKWPGFEAAFAGFDVDHVADLDADGVAALAADTRIVRNRPKILATIENARFVRDTASAHGSFGAWLADWPPADPVGLWDALKAGGARLGGNTGPFVLRQLGFDTFRFSDDVSQALIDAGVVSKPPTGKRARRAAQAAIVQWAREAELPLAHVSVVLACSTGPVYDG
jgi:3-methyladenine DNA glycosylase Tag